MLSAVLCLSLGACATGEPSLEPRLEKASEADFQDAQLLYSKSAFEASLSRLKEFERKYPGSPLVAQVENLRGLDHLMSRRQLQALDRFNRAIQLNTGSPKLNSYIYYNLATAQFELARFQDARTTLGRIAPEELNRDTRVKYHYLRARVFTKLALHDEAAREALEGGRLLQPEETELRKGMQALLEQNLKENTSQAQVQTLREQYADHPWASLLGLTPTTPITSATVPSANPSGMPTVPPGADLPFKIPYDSSVIGVLLPMRGKFSRFGEKSLQAIELALKLFGAADGAEAKLTLAVEDSGDDADQTLQALDRLVLKHHAVAVIGPLLSKGIERVSTRAAELRVPLISLARATGGQNDYVFQGGLTVKMQAQELARYAVERLKIKELAIAYPRDKIGSQANQDFWDAVDAAGGKITGSESYPADETDFRQVVDKLSGLYYTEARQRELDELAHQREENKIKKRTRKTEKYFSLPPIVDYRAVFIPEEPKSSSQLIPTFAFRDVDNIKFLGTSAWNTPEMPSRAGAYGDRTIFVDAFFADSTTPEIRRFIESYRSTFGEAPTTMEALAYDAGHLIETVLAKSSSLDRVELRDKLKDTQGFPGITGKISYKDGQLYRNLRFLTIKGDKVIEIK